MQGQLVFGQVKANIELELLKNGPIWAICDIKVDLFSSRMSDVLARALTYIQKMKPLEEVLSNSNATDVMKQAVEIAFKDLTNTNKTGLENGGSVQRGHISRGGWFPEDGGRRNDGGDPGRGQGH